MVSLTHPPQDKMAHFADDIFKCIFLNEKVRFCTKISLKFVPKDPIVPLHRYLSPSGEQPEQHELAHAL